mgnify:CR=1 FL=1
MRKVSHPTSGGVVTGLELTTPLDVAFDTTTRCIKLQHENQLLLDPWVGCSPPKTRKVPSDAQLQVLKVVLCSLKISNHGLVFMSARCTMYSPWASMLEVVKVGLFELFANSTTGKVPTNNELPSQSKSGNR